MGTSAQELERGDGQARLFLLRLHSVPPEQSFALCLRAEGAKQDVHQQPQAQILPPV